MAHQSFSCVRIMMRRKLGRFTMTRLKFISVNIAPPQHRKQILSNEFIFFNRKNFMDTFQNIAHLSGQKCWPLLEGRRMGWVCMSLSRTGLNARYIYTPFGKKLNLKKNEKMVHRRNKRGCFYN